MFESILCQVTEYDPDVLESLIGLAVEIAREGREGGRVGTLRSEVYFSGPLPCRGKGQARCLCYVQAFNGTSSWIASSHRLKVKSDTLPMAICSSCWLSRGWTVLQMKH